MARRDPGSPAAGTPGAPGSHDDDDIRRLHELGYAQELLRSMGGFSNFAVSFTIISVLSGCLTLYGFGMNVGGPVVMSIGWPLVGIMVTLVALAMAEVCSSYPTAGGLYYWSARLARRNGPLASWVTGWFNLLGQVAVTAGIDFGLASFLGAYLNLAFGMEVTPARIVLIYGTVLALHALLNTFGVRLVAFLNDVSVWWHIAGVVIIVGTLLALADNRQSPSFVFGEFVNNTGWDFPGASVYVFLLGLLLAQYTFTGYDASAHMTEETRNASVTGPWGIVMSVVVSLVAGWVLLLGITFSIQSYEGALASETGVPPVQIFLDAAGSTIGQLLLLIVIGAQFFCGMSSVTANSRMLYAFSRDGAVPGSRLWHRINPRTRTPTNSIWFCAAFSFLLGVPYLWSATAYFAVTSIAVIGLYIAYIIPIVLRLLAGDRFERGPWHLGRWSRPIGWAAVAWVTFICILFCLPQFAPVTRDTFNYAPVAVGVVTLFTFVYWYASARHWFHGPKVQGTPEELAAVERDLVT